MIGLAAFSATLALVPALSALARDQGAGDLAVGSIVAAAAAASLIFRQATTRQWGRLGCRRMWLAGGAVLVTAPLLVLAARSPLALGLARLYHGMGLALFLPLAAGGSLDERTRRSGAAAALAGLVLAPVVGGALMSAPGLSTVYALSALAALAAFIIAVLLKDAPSTHQERESDLAWLRAVWKNRTARSPLLATIAQQMMLGGLVGFLPLYALGTGIHPFAVGLLFGLLAAARDLARPLAIWIERRYGRKQALSAGLYLGAFSMVVFPATANPFALLGLAVAFGLGLGVTERIAPSYLAISRSDASHGHGAESVLGALEELGLALGALAMGVILHFNGREYWMAFVLTATLVVLLTFAFNVVTPEIHVMPGRPRKR